MKPHNKDLSPSQPASYEYDPAVDSDYGPPKGIGFKASMKRLRSWGADKAPTYPASIEQHGLKSTLKRMDILWPGEGKVERPARVRGIREIIGVVAVALVGERIANAVAEKLAAEKLKAIEQDFAEKHMPLTTISEIMDDQTPQFDLAETAQRAAQEHFASLESLDIPTMQLPIIYKPRHLDPEEPGPKADHIGQHRAPENADQTQELSRH